MVQIWSPGPYGQLSKAALAHHIAAIRQVCASSSPPDDSEENLYSKPFELLATGVGVVARLVASLPSWPSTLLPLRRAQRKPANQSTCARRSSGKCMRSSGGMLTSTRVGG